MYILAWPYQFVAATQSLLTFWYSSCSPEYKCSKHVYLWGKLKSIDYASPWYGDSKFKTPFNLLPKKNSITFTRFHTKLIARTLQQWISLTKPELSIFFLIFQFYFQIYINHLQRWLTKGDFRVTPIVLRRSPSRLFLVGVNFFWYVHFVTAFASST